MTSKLTNQRLADIYAECEERDPAITEIRAMITELQERRNAATVPVAWTDEQELRDMRRVGFGEMFSVEPISPNADMYRVIPLYRHAQPAPVVPEEATPDNIEILASTYAPLGVTYQWDGDGCNVATITWNACRAAMLQAGNSPVSVPKSPAERKASQPE